MPLSFSFGPNVTVISSTHSFSLSTLLTTGISQLHFFILIHEVCLFYVKHLKYMVKYTVKAVLIRHRIIAVKSCFSCCQCEQGFLYVIRNEIYLLSVYVLHLMKKFSTSKYVIRKKEIIHPLCWLCHVTYAFSCIQCYC